MKKILLIILILFICNTSYSHESILLGSDTWTDSDNPSTWDTPWYQEIQPRAFYKNGYTYLTYQGYLLNPYVIQYNNSTGDIVQSLAGDNSALYAANKDSHGNPAIFVDSSNYIHLFYGCHVTPMKHTKSDSANDISSFTEQDTVDDHATYPQVMIYSDNTVYLFYRGYTSSTVYPWGYKKSTDECSTFGSFVSIFSSDETAGERFYPQFKKRSNDTVGVAFTYIANYHVDSARLNVYYAYMDASEVWRNIDGDAITIPITKASADAECLAFDTSSADIDIWSLAFNSSNIPYILFKYATSPSTANILYYNGSSWVNNNQSWLTRGAEININSDDILEIYASQDRDSMFRYLSGDNGANFHIVNNIMVNGGNGTTSIPKMIYGYSDYKPMVFYTHTTSANDFNLYLGSKIYGGGRAN